MGAYAHLFAFVEAFIAPEMVALAQEAGTAGGSAFDALTNFASEEVKHIHLFREVLRRVDESLGFTLARIGGEDEVAGAVLRRSRGAVLLLTSAIEWLTQQHFTSAMKDAEDLDPLTREIFRFHWLEEAQHARLDHLETVRVFRTLDDAGRETAVEDLIWLLAALDSLLKEQAGHDVDNLGVYLGRAFTDAERGEILGQVLAAKRRCFIHTGLNHPNFLGLYNLVTTVDQRQNVRDALAVLHG